MAQIRTLSLDLETYSSEKLTKCGVYRYAEAPDFEVLLFGYSADGAPVQVVDLTAGETLPADVRSALTDPAVTKWAFNAQFERVCLSRYLGYPTGQYLDPSSWHCTMVWAATLGLPLSLEGVGAVLGLEKQKLKEGKDLIRYFCTPAKAKDGSLIRHYSTDAPEKWSLFKAYNLRDVETEMSIQQKLSKFPVTESEWRNYTLDQQINDRGIMLDRTLVTQAIRCDERFKRTHMEQARSVTGLDNPNSPVQLKAWLAEKGVEADSLSKAAVADMLEKADGEVELALSLRQELAKSSVKKYTAMQTVVGSDDRARGLIQFYGANRTGRYAGRLIQVQNLPQNHLPDLDTARALVRSGNTDAVEMLYDSVPLVLSELIRTAFVPKPGCRFYVADFSAIEARVIAWIAGEHWRQEVFAKGGDIYCASASQMFHVPVEKHGVNGHLRQKGKIAELALGYIIADNRMAMDAGWDEELLRVEIESLQAADFDPLLTGFDEKELSKLFDDGIEAKEDDFDVDAELQKPTFTKPGDIWTLGRHRLICGDSTKGETYTALMDGRKANLVITDPPYNVNYEGSAGKIKNDNMASEKFFDFLFDAFSNMEKVMADDASIYVFHADTEGLNFRKAFDAAGFYLSGCCIWKKQSLVLGRSPYQWQHEPCLYGWKKKGKHQWYTGRKESTIWEFDKPQKNGDHPTMKPIPLLAYPIQNSSMANSVVLDPFGGSGSTLIACEQTDRICYTIELDEKFCDVIVRRYIEQVGTDEKVSVLRDGKKYKFNEVCDGAE